MSSDWIRWLLDIDVIPKNAEGLRVAWEHPWPGWVWTWLLLAAAALAGWSYARLAGRRGARVVLAAARFLIIALVLVLISGPMLELPRETVERDWVLMLVDRSASMTIADVDAGPRRITREQQLRSLLDEHAVVWRDLAESRQVVWLGFHDGAFNLPVAPVLPPEAEPISPVQLDEPTGQRTRLGSALEQAMQRAAARAVSGVVLFTDGRTTDAPDRSVLRRFRTQAVPIFTVPLGSDEPLGDLAIRHVEAPRRAFVRDQVPVVVELDQLGSATQGVAALIKLIDDSTGEELDRVELPAGDDRDQVTLTAKPTLAGEATWRVVIETVKPDLIPDNNVATFVIELIDRPLRVLYVEGYPRWEYRYLKELLIREKSIESSVMLISADRDFAQEGNQPITRLPRSPEEFAQFDVIVIGDVPGSFFSPDQLEMMRDHVAQRGAGLLWIGGPRYTPSTYSGTVLADLLPMRGSLALPPIGVPVNMVPTPLADRLGVLRLSSEPQQSWPRDLVDPNFGWSKLHYAQRIEPGRLKPTAEVLTTTARLFQGTPLPLVMHLRYGAGQSIYIATDEIWRWRYGRGELYPERFWVQLIRMLGRESLTTSDSPVRLEVTPRRLTTEQAMRIDLELLDARLVDESRVTVTVQLETEDGQPVAEIELRRVDDDRQRYAASHLPGITGRLRVRVNDATLPGLDDRVPVEVYAPDDELRRPETDHRLLASLAAETGGRVLLPEQISELPGLLPNRAVTSINPLNEGIWDSPLAFGLILLVLAGEWIGRKMLRLA